MTPSNPSTPSTAVDTLTLFSVRGKTVLITGGSRGIGLMIAEGFALNGARVYITARSTADCQREAERLSRECRALNNGGSCVAIPVDLAQRGGGEQLLVEYGKYESRLDVLVNNAGVAWGAPIEEYPEAGFDKVMTLNVKRVFTTTQLFLPLLVAAATPSSPARVINIGSIDGIQVPHLQTYAYSASKAAVHQMTRHMAGHLAARRITVNAVAPGLFPSKMTKDVMSEDAGEAVPLGRVGERDDVAGVCLYLASHAARWVTGAIIVVDGGQLVKSRL